MKAFTVRDAVNAVGGKFFGPESALERVVVNVVSDSRKIENGTLFTAFKGVRADGHDFMADCLARGACACLSEREPHDESEEPCIVVDSCLRAAGALAAWYRGLFDIPVIGITGSVGKTTTKEMVSATLGAALNVHKTQKNFNNELGVPRTLINMPEDAQAAVIEMGISNFGEMTRLTNMVHPKLVIITVIGDAHLEFLGDHAGVLRAKTEIFNSMDQDCLAILNGDDETLKNYVPPIPCIRYGLEPGNDFVAEDIENLAGAGMRMTIRHHSKSFRCHISAFGAHLPYSALAAACAGWALGLSDEDIARGIASYETVGNRARLIEANGYCVISDCYNANPSSVKSSVNSLATLNGRKVCILGDMLELGENSPVMHYDIGVYAAEHGVELLLASGELSRETVRGAEAAGKCEAHWFDSKEALTAALTEYIKKGDSILVKASHSMAFETVVDSLVK